MSDDVHPLDYYPEEETGDDLTDSLMLIDKARAAPTRYGDVVKLRHAKCPGAASTARDRHQEVSLMRPYDTAPSAFDLLRQTLSEMERIGAEADAMGPPIRSVAVDLTVDQRERFQARQRRQVYVAQAANGMVKIGYSRFPQRRVRQIQAAQRMSVRLIGTLVGGRIEEAALHRRFASDRAYGEWFFPSTAILDFVRTEITRE